MRARSSFVVLVALVAAWVLTLAPRLASAQVTTSSGPSVTGIVGVVSRLEPDGVTSADNANEHPHPNGVPVNALNFEDCEANLEYGFSLGISGIDPSYNLNIWAGTQDCSQLANRQAATAVCWPLINPKIATTNPFPVTVRMQDIASQAADTTHTVTYAAAGISACTAQTVTGASNISLYFFFADDEGNAVGSEATYAITLDTRAGDVQGNISVGLGDTLLIVNIPATTDPDTQEWNAYCDPPPGQASSNGNVPVDAASNNGVCPVDTGAPVDANDGASDDGALDAEEAAVDATPFDSAVPIVLDDAGGNACGVPLNDAGIPSPGGCSQSAYLVPGVSEDAGSDLTEEEGGTGDVEGVLINGGNMVLLPSRLLCGTSGASSSQIIIKNLTNGVFYNIAVGAVDAVGNVGPLSNVVCAYPAPVDDFYKNYYNDDGRAGGGFCSTEGAATPAGTGGLGALMVASIVAIVRRRRRK